MSTQSEITPTIIEIDGRQWWDFGSRRLPVIRGGSDGGDGGDGGNGGGTGNSDNTGDDDTGDGNNDDDTLGEGGKKALESERRARSAAEKAAKAAAEERDELAKRIEDLEAEGKSENEKAVDKAVREAEERGRTKALTEANQRLVRSEVRVAASTKLADPEDAVRFLELDEFKVSNTGEVDSEAIATAIDALVEEKPYLAAKAKKPKGDIDQGARETASAKAQPGLDRISRAYADSGRKNT